jgi:HD-like signal output (HDOD) protein
MSPNFVEPPHPAPTLDEVCSRALALPCSPTLMPKLLAALHGDQTTAEEIERIIQMDSALATATLRLANSAYYGPRACVEKLEQAVVMLGHKEIYRLATLTMVSRWEDVHSAALPWEPGEYTRHALCTALAAEVLAETGETCDPRIAYTAGLVCDIGKLVLAYVCAPFYPKISAWARHEGRTWEEAERAILGYDHAEVGTRLLRAWRFPEKFAQLAEYQLHPEDAPIEVLPLLADLHAAKYLAVSLGPGVTEGGFLFALHGAFLTEYGFTTDFLEEALIEVRERALRRMGDRLSHGAFRA